MSVFKYSLSAFSQAQNAPEEFEEDIKQNNFNIFWCFLLA